MATTMAALASVSTRGAGERALAGASRAVRQARLASDDVFGGASNSQPAVDFTPLGLEGWNRCGA
eukprot:5867411-Pleurochrysis_carterae.AAC.1